MFLRSFCRKLLTFFLIAGVAVAAGNLVLSVPAEAKASQTQKAKSKTKAKTKAKAKTKKTKLSKKSRRPRAPVAADAGGEGGLYADIVIEARTGRILHATNASNRRHPASLTKMMTLYLTFQALESGKLSLDQRLPISAYAAKQSPTKLCLRAGQTVRVQDAILGLVTISANDAAVVLAEALGGNASHFADMMTRQARALGMEQTNFDNPNGLPDPDQVTSARDMAVLAQALIYHYPRFYPYFSQESYVYAGIERRNHNHLMERYDGMDGLKTGYIRASGFNLVASAVRGNVRLIGVVFGGRSAPARDRQMEALLDNGFAALQGRVSDAAPEGQGDANEDDFLPAPPKNAVAFTKSAPASAPAVVQASTPPSARGDGLWAIQIGAFNDQAQAQKTLKTTSRKTGPLLSSAHPQIDQITTDAGATLYRARYLGVDEKMARSVCAYLIKHAQSCMVVAP